MKQYFLSLLCALASVYIYAQTNDDFANATLIQHQDGWSSGNGAYHFSNATFDKENNSCRLVSNEKNVWFKFVAGESEFIRIKAINDQIIHLSMSLWSVSGNDVLTEMACNRVGGARDFEVSSDQLVQGQTYYISLSSGYAGNNTFGLLVETTYDYNYYKGATPIQHQEGWSSATDEYNFVDATFNKQNNSCRVVQNEPNRWFKFTASSDFIRIKALNEAIIHFSMSLWSESGDQLTELTCNKVSGARFEISSNGLTVGQTYYVSISSNYANNNTFGLQVFETYNYNYFQGATLVQHEDGWSSSADEYDFIDTSFDKQNNSCRLVNNENNVWFKFVAGESEFIRIKAINDQIIHLSMSLWSVSGTDVLTEMACNRVGEARDFEVSSNQLVQGQTYYISLSSGHAGNNTFGLLVETTYDYNYFQGAEEIPHRSNWSSESEAFDFIFATFDKQNNSCRLVQNEPNRWFKFTATSESVKINTIGNQIIHLSMSLWSESNDNGLVELQCNYLGAAETLEISNDNLIEGQTYYLSVSSNYAATKTFGLHVGGGIDIIWASSGNTVHPYDLQSKVGIGTNDVPSEYLFAVQGLGLFEGVKVSLVENWPDFVFANDYTLRPLEEVETFISHNKHLPDIPSESEVTKRGIELGEMDAKLLQKVEELTLYIIDINKRMNQLESENKALKLKIAEFDKESEGN